MPLVPYHLFSFSTSMPTLVPPRSVIPWDTPLRVSNSRASAGMGGTGMGPRRHPAVVTGTRLKIERLVGPDHPRHCSRRQAGDTAGREPHAAQGHGKSDCLSIWGLPTPGPTQWATLRWKSEDQPHHTTRKRPARIIRNRESPKQLRVLTGRPSNSRPARLPARPRRIAGVLLACSAREHLRGPPSPQEPLNAKSSASGSVGTQFDHRRKSRSGVAG